MGKKWLEMRRVYTRPRNSTAFHQNKGYVKMKNIFNTYQNNFAYYFGCDSAIHVISTKLTQVMSIVEQCPKLIISKTFNCVGLKKNNRCCSQAEQTPFTSTDVLEIALFHGGTYTNPAFIPSLLYELHMVTDLSAHCSRGRPGFHHTWL